MRLTPGTRLGSYDILASLGAGGMGEVYRARDPRLEREVAVKVLPESVAIDPDRLARFEREAKAVAALNHPNIVTLYSLEESEGTRFLTMELIDGQSLDREIAPGGLPLARVLALAIPLADALVAAHERGIIHRDLKPANVMVTRGGRLKVLDFGLAKLAGPERISDDAQALTVEAPISSVGQVVGTAPYMAPEQLRGEVADARTDLFALGVILYELAAGRRPFIGSTMADVTSAILRDAPPSLSGLRGDLPSDLHRIVGRCLEKDRGRRLQTAKDVRLELELLLASISHLPPSPASSPSGSFASITPPPSLATTPPADDVPSIAVLPFVNRSRDAEDEYFSDGLADELLSLLAKLRGLRVAARTSSFHFKGKDDDLATIGRKLNVATLLEGSVRKSGNRVRITVQLVKVADGFHLWSETYDRTLDDIFAVQDDIAQSVVKELRGALMGELPDSKQSGDLRAAVEAATRGRVGKPEAHRLLLQGRYFVERFTREDLARAAAYLRQAVELDPDYALAWVELGRTVNLQSGYGWIPPAAGIEEARAMAQRAMHLEPDLAEAWTLLGVIQASHDWDWAAADASFRRASGPGSSGGGFHTRAIGNLALWLGRIDEAVDLARRATEFDPLSATAFSTLGNCLRYADRFGEAERAMEKALELAPQRSISRMILGLIRLGQGRLDDALRTVESEPEPFARLTGLAISYHAVGRASESDAMLRELIATAAHDCAYQIAGIHSVRGELDLAFEWLDKAHFQRDGGLAFARNEPVFRPLHGDPRWAEFMRKMGFWE